MSDRPLVSVLTPTWRRHDDLVGAIENVRAQTYRPLEHVIVSDGLDPDADEIVESMHADSTLDLDQSRYVPLRFVELGRNWSSVLPNSFCAAPIIVAQLLARGAYHSLLSDDERMESDHVATFVERLEATGADFVYGRVLVYRAGLDPSQGHVIGAFPPRLGEITNALYRSDVLKLSAYPFGAGMTSDWAMFSLWQSLGARCEFVDRVTLTHRTDH